MIYAVNKRTLEHRVAYGDEAFGNMPDDTESHAFLEADPDGWIEWQGGECPLPDDGGVQVKTNIGIANAGPAGEFRWARQSCSGDIIAYRPILDAGDSDSSHSLRAGDFVNGGNKESPRKFAVVASHGEWVWLRNIEKPESKGIIYPASLTLPWGTEEHGQADEPEPPAWDGESWPPPIGCVLETKASEAKAKIIAIEDGHVIGWDAEYAFSGTLEREHCRPIRSEEDRAVEAMKVAMENFPYDDTKQHLSELVYAAIRDGKVPRVKLEDSND